MGRKSTIKMLPKAVQAQISNLHRAGYTNQQITQHLRELGGNTVSKSAVQRWAKDLNRVGKRLQESRALVEGLVANLALRQPAFNPSPPSLMESPRGALPPPRFALRHCKKEVALLL